MAQDILEERIVRAVQFLRTYPSEKLLGDKRVRRNKLYYHDKKLAGLLLSCQNLLPEIMAGLTKANLSMEGVPPKLRDFALKATQLIQDYEAINNVICRSPIDDVVADVLQRAMPDVILDIPCGDGQRILEYYPIIAEHYKNANKKFKIIGIDFDMEILQSAKTDDLEELELRLGNLKPNGEIKLSYPSCYVLPNIRQFDHKVLKQEGTKLVLAINACGCVSDYIGKFIANNNIDYFIIKRCHYNQLQGRRSFSQTAASIPYTDNLVYILNPGYEDLVNRKGTAPRFEKFLKTLLRSMGKLRILDYIPHVVTVHVHPLLQQANLIFSDVYKWIVDSDLALELQSKGYIAKVAKVDDTHVIYGNKRDKAK